MQDMPLAQLDLREFERLLTNRGCLLLMNHLDNGHEHISKYINKAWLAIGDALLALAGKYEISYLNKKLAIEQVTRNERVANLIVETAFNARPKGDGNGECRSWRHLGCRR